MFTIDEEDIASVKGVNVSCLFNLFKAAGVSSVSFVFCNSSKIDE